RPDVAPGPLGQRGVLGQAGAGQLARGGPGRGLLVVEPADGQPEEPALLAQDLQQLVALAQGGAAGVVGAHGVPPCLSSGWMGRAVRPAVRYCEEATGEPGRFRSAIAVLGPGNPGRISVVRASRVNCDDGGADTPVARVTHVLG